MLEEGVGTMTSTVMRAYNESLGLSPEAESVFGNHVQNFRLNI